MPVHQTARTFADIPPVIGVVGGFIVGAAIRLLNYRMTCFSVFQ